MVAPKRKISAVVALLFVAPLVAEFLLGNLSLKLLPALIVLVPMYGGGAVLIRETVRRAGRGWPSMLMLGAAYTLIEEGFATQSLFNPDYLRMHMHLLDHARSYIEEHKARPWPERFLRAALVKVLTHRGLFRLSLVGALIAKPFATLLPRQLRAMVRQAPASLPPPGPAASPGVFAAEGPKRARMALLSGCVQPVLAPDIDEAVVRLLTRHGVEMVVAADQACCGAMAQHMGDEAQALERAKANIAAWENLGALDAIVISASGCGTVVKEYGFMLRNDPQWAARAARISALTKDVTEVLAGMELKKPVIPAGQPVAYHSACSLQHGQKISNPPRELLARAGFEVREIGEGHICCGSAGTYSMLQPELAGQLRERKLANIAATSAPIVAAGNIGCIQHLAPKMGQSGGARMIHTAELLDWATGGPKPEAL